MKDELIEQIRNTRKNIFLKTCRSDANKFFAIIEKEETKEKTDKLVDTVVVTKVKEKVV